MNKTDTNLSSSSSSTSTSSSSQYFKVDIDNNLDALGLSHNYSLLIRKLEKLAFGDTASSTLLPPEFHHAILSGGFQHHLHQQQQYSPLSLSDDKNNFNNNGLTEGTTVIHSINDAEYSRFISDVWIGIVLTLLILSIIFFICSCFLYHKFQQWKNSYRTNNSEPEIIRRYDIDCESLPSYTLVSGLPSYDDALEQFRKAGILIQQPSVIKIFEDMSSSTIKTPLKGGNEISLGTEKTIEMENTTNLNNAEESLSNDTHTISSDNVSVNSCGGATNSINSGGNTSTTTTSSSSSAPLTSQSVTTLSTLASVIELNPEQLKILSQKRLSLQIAFNGNAGDGSISSSSIRLSSKNRTGRGKIDLCREVNRNNLLRSHEFPRIHRSTSSLNNERSILAQRLKSLHHRGSLA